MQVIDGTRKGERMEGDRRQNRVVMMRPVGCEHAVILELGPEEGMEALEIESQTDQTPLAGSRQFPAQGKLAKTQHLLDDADHRFDGAFACFTCELVSSGGGSGSGAKRCCQLG